MSITIASWLLTIGMFTFFVLYPSRRRYRAPRDPHAPPSIAMTIFGWGYMLTIFAIIWLAHSH